MLPGCLVFVVVTPLHFAHLEDLTASHSFCSIQNCMIDLLLDQAVPLVSTLLELVSTS
jgi:hypothetical protein